MNIARQTLILAGLVTACLSASTHAGYFNRIVQRARGSAATLKATLLNKRFHQGYIAGGIGGAIMGYSTLYFGEKYGLFYIVTPQRFSYLKDRIEHQNRINNEKQRDTLKTKIEELQYRLDRLSRNNE